MDVSSISSSSVELPCFPKQEKTVLIELIDIANILRESNLKELDLDLFKIDDFSIQLFADSLNDSGLKKLKLQSPQLSYKQILIVAKGVMNSSIEEFTLNTYINREIIDEFADILCQSSSLRKVDFSVRNGDLSKIDHVLNKFRTHNIAVDVYEEFDWC